jgi:hypothetical protein
MLTWTASTGASSYHVKRATTSGGPFAQVGAPTSDTYTDTSLTNGTTYYYVVSALDSAGESANSAQVSALPVAPVVATAPLAITTTFFTTANQNVAYTATLTASGGVPPYSWTATGVPAGLSLSTSGALTGTPTAVGTSTIALQVKDSEANPQTATASLNLVVEAASTASSNPCGMQLGGTPIFCDTFDAPAGTGTRAGQLNGNVWGVSRTMGDSGVNLGQAAYNLWNATTIQKCDGTTPTVNAPNDVIICNGQVREATNDNNTGVFDAGDVLTLAMYPKQPFDFAGRTGSVSFDVSNDSGGVHTAWPEFWMSDLPVPAPFSHFGSWVTMPANGFGIRLSSVAPAGVQGECPNANNLTKPRWTVESAVAARNYVLDDTDGYGTPSSMTMTQLDCVISSTGPGNMNHVEFRISQNQIDVYATDAGVVATATTLRHIATVTNANLTFTRGLIWLEDVHYNADKGDVPPAPSQRQHTFSWDNVAFDGPFTDRDFAYDAPDNTVPGPNGAVNLGQMAMPNQTVSWNVPNLPANPQAGAVRVLFDFNEENRPNPTVLNVIVNGHATSVPWPYPDQLEYTWRTLAVTIPISWLVPGTNVVQLGADTAEVFANVDIVLGDVTGGMPVLPGANDAYP